MIDKKYEIEINKAVEMLIEGEYVHTFRNSTGLLLGADWNREDIIELLKEKGAFGSGEMAKSMGHGLVTEDKTGFLFIETKRSKEK